MPTEIPSTECPVEGESFRFSLRRLFVVLTIVALALFILGWLWRSANFLNFPEVVPKPFDANEWKAWSIEDTRQSEDIRRLFARRDMLDDLLARTSFIGKTPAQLTLLLGPANPEFCPKEWDVAYLLGIDFIDYVVLVFRLDTNGKIESHRVIMF